MRRTFYILAVALWVCVTGCQAIVNFDRSLLIDAGTDADVGADAGPDTDDAP